MSTLNERILARKKEAGDKRIFNKALEVVRELGRRNYTAHDVSKNISLSRSFRNSEGKRLVNRFSRDELTITFASGGREEGEYIIEYQGKKVFFAQVNDIVTYVPGKWEQLLDVAYASAVTKKEKREKKVHEETLKNDRTFSRSKQGRAVRQNWGL